MLKNIPRRLRVWLSALVMGLFFGSALQIALAWTVPSAVPPGSNVAPPLNTSATDQTKTGSLTISGVGEYVRASHFSDQNNTGYYLDPNGTSNLYNVNAAGAINATGIVQSAASIRAPYFTDQNNTGYYLDPNGTSNLYNVNTVGAVIATGTVLSRTALRAPYFTDHDNTTYYLDPNSSSKLSFAEFNNLNSLGYVSANRMVASAYMQAPVFYDNNNINYKLDPNSWSVVSAIYADSQIYSPVLYDTNNANYYVDPNNWSALNAVIAYSQVWSPIYYDQDNTAYYLNPNGLSNVDRIKTGSESDMGANSVNTDKLCINGVCKTSWPDDGGGYTCECYNQGGPTFGEAGMKVWRNCGSGWVLSAYTMAANGGATTYFKAYFPCK